MLRDFFFILLLLSAISGACTRVVNIDINNPLTGQIAVEGSVTHFANVFSSTFDKIGMKKNQQNIRISKILGINDEDKRVNENLQYVPIKDAMVKIMDVENNITYDLDYNAALDTIGYQGIYSTILTPTIGNTYKLMISHGGNNYYALTDPLPNPVPIKKAEIAENDLFPDEPDTFVYFDDPPEEINFYYWKTFFSSETLDTNPTEVQVGIDNSKFNVIGEDVLFNGIENYKRGVVSAIKDFSPDYNVHILQYSINQQHYNFLELALQFITGGGPDNSAFPARLKGNIINETNPSFYAYGYFFSASVFHYSVQTR